MKLFCWLIGVCHLVITPPRTCRLTNDKLIEQKQNVAALTTPWTCTWRKFCTTCGIILLKRDTITTIKKKKEKLN